MANVTGWYAEVSATVTVPRMAATALLKPPVVSTVSPFVVAPPRMSATATMPAPALGFSTTITAPRMAASAAMPVPVVANYVNAAVTVPRMSATASLAAPAVDVSYANTIPRMAATAAMPTPVVATMNGVTYTDLFNRSNSSTLGASWTTDTGFGISLTINSNAAVSGSGSRCGSIYVSPMSTGDNEITVVMKGTPTDGDLLSITARSNSATKLSDATRYVRLFIIHNNTWFIQRYAGDSGVGSASPLTWGNGDTIVFSCVGATLTAKKNGSTIMTTGGSTDLSAGYVELDVLSQSTGAGLGFDSFTAQDI